MDSQRVLFMVAMALAVMPCPVWAEEESFFSDRIPHLTATGKDAVVLARQWEAKTSSAPILAPDGAVRFMVGVQQPTIVCKTLELCDVMLQTGEQVKSIHMADQVRWMASIDTEGTAPNEIAHVIIKALDTGLETSLLILTDRRHYYAKLYSHPTEHTPRVAFMYPEEAGVKRNIVTPAPNRETSRKLDFAYEVTGSASWIPSHVYNDSRKTTIQMPREMAEAPVLLVVLREGTFLADEATAVVNYRVSGNRYIVDSVFDRAILVSGVGDAQERVTLARKKQDPAE